MSEGSLDRKINMTTNQDTTRDELLKYFTDDTPVAEEKFVRNKILIAKDNQGAQVSKEY